MNSPFRLAAPSCVLPDRVGPNCRALASRVSEVALMFLETEGCLAYDHVDLPPDLPDLGLTWHMHLPDDLPWNLGAGKVCDTITHLQRKIAFLEPWGYVLHPPKPGCLTELVEKCPHLASRLCLENTRHGDLTDIWDEIVRYDTGVCLDIGHLVSYSQERVLDLKGLYDRVRILHVYGGESGRGHQSLDKLPDPALLEHIMQKITGPCVVVVEVFSMDKLERSLKLLRSWMHSWGML